MTSNQTTSNADHDTLDVPEPAGKYKWTKINDCATSESILPTPRHGHRAIAYGNFMIVFGGGNRGLIDELHVFDTQTNQWFQPETTGAPPACGGAGAVLHGSRILMYGGLLEYSLFSNSLYELHVPTWSWKKLAPEGPSNGNPPCARLGHSFTLIKDKVYLFGGVTKDYDDLNVMMPRTLNDLYTLHLSNRNGLWKIPLTYGSPPSPRDGHSAVEYISKDKLLHKLIIYGGMKDALRLGDLYILDIKTNMWCRPELAGNLPSPRSLHSATLMGDKMYIFGGWTPMSEEELENRNEQMKDQGFKWKLTNSLASFNLETFLWENLHQDCIDEKVPLPRAGHSAVVIDRRIYLWSGKNSSNQVGEKQTCYQELWQLEFEKEVDSEEISSVNTSFELPPLVLMPQANEGSQSEIDKVFRKLKRDQEASRFAVEVECRERDELTKRLGPLLEELANGTILKTPGKEPDQLPDSSEVRVTSEDESFPSNVRMASQLLPSTANAIAKARASQGIRKQRNEIIIQKRNKPVDTNQPSQYKEVMVLATFPGYKIVVDKPSVATSFTKGPPQKPAKMGAINLEALTDREGFKKPRSRKLILGVAKTSKDDAITNASVLELFDDVINSVIITANLRYMQPETIRIPPTPNPVDTPSTGQTVDLHDTRELPKVKLAPYKTSTEQEVVRLLRLEEGYRKKISIRETPITLQMSGAQKPAKLPRLGGQLTETCENQDPEAAAGISKILTVGPTLFPVNPRRSLVPISGVRLPASKNTRSNTNEGVGRIIEIVELDDDDDLGDGAVQSNL